MTLGSDFQQLGLGGTYTLLSYGNWRLRGQLEGMRGLGTSRFSVLYSGATPGHYLDVSGRVETQTIAPGVNLTYVSSGAGEYGLTVEPHYSILRWRTDRLVVDFPGIKGRFPEERRSISFNDTFLSLHATYLLRFAAFGVVTRVAYGVNVSGKRRDIGSYSEAELASVSRDLLETVRPRQELKFSAGVRF